MKTSAYDIHPGHAEGSPLIISVPHAGRDYPADALRRARLGVDRLRRLEDRHADLLVGGLVDAGHRAIVARAPRALIDLNRDERDIDPRCVCNIPHNQPLIQSLKQRGGLGVFPRAIPGEGDIWTGAIDWAQAQERLETIHRPYHAALETLMRDASRTHGCSLLIDVHSMPPVKAEGAGATPPDVVIGDRFGASASGRLSAVALSVVSAFGWQGALNHPYPGSYLLERHGRPELGRHALQVEISRTLYLDDQHRDPSDGVRRVQGMLLAMADALVEELAGSPWAMAAE